MLGGRLRLLVAASAIALVACADEGAERDASGSQDGVSYDVVMQGTGTYNGKDPTPKKQMVVLRSAEEAAAYKSRLQEASISLAEDLPAIDYEERMLVVVAAGRMTGGYSFDVEEVERANGELVLRVVETEPGNCLVTQALTYPHVVIAMKQHPADPRLELRTRHRAC